MTTVRAEVLDLLKKPALGSEDSCRAELARLSKDYEGLISLMHHCLEDHKEYVRLYAAQALVKHYLKDHHEQKIRLLLNRASATARAALFYTLVVNSREINGEILRGQDFRDTLENIGEWIAQSDSERAGHGLAAANAAAWLGVDISPLLPYLRKALAKEEAWIGERALRTLDIWAKKGSKQSEKVIEFISTYERINPALESVSSRILEQCRRRIRN